MQRQRRELDVSVKLNADEFLKRLKTLRSSEVATSHSHLASDDDAILGVRMGQVFALAKECTDMLPACRV